MQQQFFLYIFVIIKFGRVTEGAELCPAFSLHSGVSCLAPAGIEN